MHEIAFADAARQNASACLGLKLDAYSLGHELLLLNQRNGLLTLGFKDFSNLPVDDQQWHLMFAVGTCERDWKANQKKMRNFRFWKWTLRKANWPLEIAEFRNYLDAAHTAFSGPSESVDSILASAHGYSAMKDSRGRTSGAPLIARLYHFVHSQIRPVETWDYPFAMATMLYQTHLEAEGSLRIENQDEQDEAENLKEIDRQIAAEREAEKKKQKSGLATAPPDLEEGLRQV